MSLHPLGVLRIDGGGGETNPGMFGKPNIINFVGGGVWDGDRWDPSHPYQVHNGHPTEIPPKRILGGVVYNYRLQYMYTALMLR